MTDAESKVEGATLAMMSGNLPKAERICREVIAAQPDTARAHLILGIVAQRTGRHQEAVGHLTQAHELDPSSYDAASCLAAAYRILGQMGEAAPFAEIAVRLKPNDANARLELGSMYLEGMALRAAEGQLRKAVDLSGGDPNALFTLAQCLEREGKLDEAARVAREGLRIRPMNLDHLSGFIGSMIRQTCPVCAAEGAMAALSLAPERLRARALPARALMEARREAEALAILDDPATARSAEAEQEDSEALAVLGMLLQSFGRLDEARKILRRGLEAPQPVAVAFYTYTHCGRMSAEDAWIVRDLEARIKAPTLDDPTALHFALGKAYEDLGEYGKAMEQYDAANNPPERQDLARAPSGPLQQAIFTREFLEANRGHGSDTDLPILVVGMVRSGTTLAEQILSSHPKIGGAGEVPFWNYNTADLTDYGAGSVRTEFLRDAAERYVSVLSAAAPGMERVVDKMPANFKSLGVVRLALPNARIIHMRRSPIDTCISIYATFGVGLGEFDQSKRSLVDVYRVYQQDMAHWRSVLPADRFLEVDYESLVSDPEPTIRRMIDFCGLEWDEACLHPEANARGVSTPSLWQVRRPINKGSVERWRRFEPWLGEFAELF